MKEYKNIIAACIVAIGLISASLIYAYSTRYEIVKTPDLIVKVDRWTGKFENLKRQ